MKALLALDLATSTGFALRSANGLIQSGSQRFQKGLAVGPFLIAYERWLAESLTVWQPEVVAFEAPWVGGVTHQDTARKLMCLAGVTEMACLKAPSVQRHFEANNASVRKHFLGKGRGDRKELKRLAIDACRARGWDPENDDEADALALLDYLAHCINEPITAGPLFKAEAPAG